MGDDKYVTVKDLANILGISEKSIRLWRREIEETLGYSISQIKRDRHIRYYVFPQYSISILQDWKIRKSKDSFLTKYKSLCVDSTCSQLTQSESFTSKV